MIAHCKYVSVWDDGIQLESDALVDLDTDQIVDIEIVKFDFDSDILTDEYVIVEGKKYSVVYDDNNNIFIKR